MVSCCCSVIKSCPTHCDPMNCNPRLPCPPLTPQVYSNSWSLSQGCYLPTSSSVTPCPFALITPSIKIFPDALHIRWPKVWSCSNSPSNEFSGLISFRIDWIDFLAVQEVLRSFLQHHISKSVLLCSALFMVQLSHPCITLKNHMDLCQRSGVSAS